MPSKTKTIPPHTHQTIWDRLGIVGSALCVIHCISAPLLIGVFSAAGIGFLGDDIFHQILAVCLLFVAVLAFLPGFRSHQNRLVVLLGVVGVGLILSTGFLLEPLISHGLEIGLTIAGSLLLVGAHAANWRLSNEAECCPGH